MKIVHSAPKLELTEKEYQLLDDVYTLITVIDSNLTDEDWNCLNSYFDVSLGDVRNAIGFLMDWSTNDL